MATTRQTHQSGAAQAPDVIKALVAIAHHARERQYGRGHDGCSEPLLSWERVAEFDAFRITVRCDYNLQPQVQDARSENKLR